MSGTSLQLMAAFYGVPETVIEHMHSDMDAEASEYWAYPDEQWQFKFEAMWLEERGYTAAAAKARMSIKE